MEIRFRCPSCSATNELETAAQSEVICAVCTKKIDLHLTEAIRLREVIDRCPVCGSAHLYVQKDFNQKLGLGIVILAGAVGLLFVALDRPVGFYLALLSAVLIDALLYLLLPKVTICYACRSECRGFAPNPEHGPFDLKVADVYDRKQGGGCDPNGSNRLGGGTGGR